MSLDQNEHFYHEEFWKFENSTIPRISFEILNFVEFGFSQIFSTKNMQRLVFLN
jgi:hypothetical protein